MLCRRYSHGKSTEATSSSACASFWQSVTENGRGVKGPSVSGLDALKQCAVTHFGLRLQDFLIVVGYAVTWSVTSPPYPEIIFLLAFKRFSQRRCFFLYLTLRYSFSSSSPTLRNFGVPGPSRGACPQAGPGLLCQINILLMFSLDSLDFSWEYGSGYQFWNCVRNNWNF